MNYLNITGKLQGFCSIIAVILDGVLMQNLRPLLGGLLCWLGFHDFEVISKTFGFGDGGGVEKVECKRCGIVVTRQN